jgi:hypothetical protein
MKVMKKVWEKEFDANARIKLREIPKEYLINKDNKDYYIDIEKDETAEYPYALLVIEEYRDQTKEEVEEFKRKLQKMSDESKEMRRRQYEQLKKEFEK